MFGYIQFTDIITNLKKKITCIAYAHHTVHNVSRQLSLTIVKLDPPQFYFYAFNSPLHRKITQ